MKNLIRLFLMISFFLVQNLFVLGQVQSIGLFKTFFVSNQNIDLDDNLKENVHSIAKEKTYFIPSDFYNSIQNFIDPPELTFNTEGLIWADYDSDETFLSNGVNVAGNFFLDHKFSIIIENHIYNIYQNGIRAGSFITKRDLTTGVLIWKRSNNLTNNESIELDFSIRERDDGNIEVYGFRLLSDFVPNLNPTGVVNRKVINVDTGELISQHFTEFSDGGAFCININGQFGSTFPITEDDTFITNCSFGSNLTANITSDADGVLLDTVNIAGSSLEFESAPRTRYTGAQKLPNGNIAVPVTLFNEVFTLDEILAEVLIFDSAGNLLNRIDVTETMNFATFIEMKIVEDKIILFGTSFQELVDQELTFTGNIAVIDEFGQVFNQINNIEDYTGSRATLDENGELWVLGRSKANNCLHILNEIDNELTSIHEICHTSEKWYQEIQYFDIVDNTLLMNARIIFDTLLVGNINNISGIAVAPFSAAFDLDELDLVLSDENITPDLKNSFDIFPNPSSGFVNIIFDKIESGELRLLNQLGTMIRNTKIENGQQYIWNTSSLSSGVYFVQFENEEGIGNIKLVITK